MLAYAGDVLFGEAVPLFRSDCLVPGHEGREAHLGVDYDLPSVGIMDYYVGNQGAPVVTLDLVTEFIAYDSLHVEVHAFLQAALAQQVHQQHLPEISLGLALAGNGVGKGLGLVAYGLALLGKEMYHLFHRAAALGVLFVGTLDAFAELLELLLDGLQEFAYALRAGLAEVLAVLGAEGLENVAHLLKRLRRLVLLLLDAGLALLVQLLLCFLLGIEPGRQRRLVGAQFDDRRYSQQCYYS